MSKTLSASMSTLLSSEVQKVCLCWKITRTDGTIQGFTDHDENVTVDSVVYSPTDGVETTSITQSLGLSVDNLNVNGALSTTSLNEADLEAGYYDDAAVELYLVGWSDPDNENLLLAKGSIGEVERFETAFSAEFRSLAHRLNQPIGSKFIRNCPHVLGDSKCQVDLYDTTGIYALENAALTTSSGRIFEVVGADGFDDGWFTRGNMIIQSGDEVGRNYRIKRHEGTAIELWETPKIGITTSDTVSLTAGCDKLFPTCISKFLNGDNFGGHPHMPGSDLMMRVIRIEDEGEAREGGSLFKGDTRIGYGGNTNT